MIDLSDYTASLAYEISPPGQNLYPNMSTTEAVGRMVDAFWEMRLYGLDFLSAWTCSADGLITPQTNVPMSQYGGGIVLPGWYEDDGSGDLGREIIQAIVLFAGYRIALTSAQNLNSMVRSQAGSVSYETQKSSQLVQSVLKALTSKIDIVLTRLSDLGSTAVAVLDSVVQREYSEVQGYSWWVE
jgi:hypothetical protein